MAMILVSRAFSEIEATIPSLSCLLAGSLTVPAPVDVLQSLKAHVPATEWVAAVPVRPHWSSDV